LETVWYQGRAGRCESPLGDISAKEGGYAVGVGTQCALVQRIVPNDIKTIYQGLGDVGVLVVLWVLLLVIAVRGRGKMDYVGMGMMDLATQVLVEVAAG
jgi:hypothetical protein